MKNLIIAGALALALVGCNQSSIGCSTSVSFAAVSATCTGKGGSLAVSLSPSQIITLFGIQIPAGLPALDSSRNSGPVDGIDAKLNIKARTVTFTNKETGVSITVPVKE